MSKEILNKPLPLVALSCCGWFGVGGGVGCVNVGSCGWRWVGFECFACFGFWCGAGSVWLGLV